MPVDCILTFLNAQTGIFRLPCGQVPGKRRGAGLAIEPGHDVPGLARASRGAMSVVVSHGPAEEFGLTIPLVVLVLLIAGALGSLVLGLPSPDLTAVDGIAPFAGIP
jgi:hypothetical protein